MRGLVRGGQQRNPPHGDLLFAFARLGNVVGRLQTHPCVHLDADRLFNTTSPIPERSVLPIDITNTRGSRGRLPLVFVTVIVAYAPTGSATRTLTGVSQL